MLIQELWKRGFQWDDILPDDVVQQWEKIKRNIEAISVSEIPRYVGSTTNAFCELHVFCDASTKACAAATYLVRRSSEKVDSHLILSKTRLAPVKSTQTIPRLELIAVVLGLRILKFAQEQLKVKTTRSIVWTDSQCTLHWIKRDRISTRFVENRLKEIRKHFDVEFRYVPSEENPADMPTRGCDATAMTEHDLWWNGPNWLTTDESHWPIFDKSVDIQEKEETILPNDTEQQHCSCIDEERFSSLTKLLRCTSYVLRFIKNARLSDDRRTKGQLNSTELQAAEAILCKSVQEKYFPDLMDFKEKEWNKGIGRQLKLFKDDYGVLRSAGRIQNSTMTYNAKYPVLLPKEAHFTKLVILDCHQRLIHSGTAQTLAQVRLKYWIIHGRNTVRKAVASCQFCVRHEGKPFKIPDPPNLPKERVVESPPFSNCGLDYLGPLFVKEVDKESTKVWICLYTCMVTRAIHLDVVNSLSADQFLMSLRRFSALYGFPKYILTDNATQFKASAKLLNRLRSETNEVKEFLQDHGVTWRFVVEFAPWMGGFYERLVGIVKRALRKSLDKKLVSCTELNTVVLEVSSVVNSRPLVYVENDLEILPLTPSHLLNGRDKCHVPQFTALEEEYVPFHVKSDELLTRWRRLQAICTNFWNLWRNQYLISLRERDVSTKQRNCTEKDPKLNSVVHIKDHSPRVQWKIAKIVELHRSRDGCIRSATLRLSNGKHVRRPIKLLFPLEVNNAKSEETSDHSTTEEQSNPTRHLQRQAAVNARIKWKTILVNMTLYGYPVLCRGSSHLRQRFRGFNGPGYM